MRTPLTIDDDLMALLQDEAHRRRVPFRDVVNDTLRRALTEPPRARRRVPSKTYPSKLHTGLDPAGFNQLADELEDESIAKRLANGRWSSATSNQGLRWVIPPGVVGPDHQERAHAAGRVSSCFTSASACST